MSHVHRNHHNLAKSRALLQDQVMRPASVPRRGSRPCSSAEHVCISPRELLWQMRKLLTHQKEVVHRVYTAQGCSHFGTRRGSAPVARSGSRSCLSGEHVCISPRAMLWQMRKLLTHQKAVVHRVYTAQGSSHFSTR